ncbi:MAG TPA: endonuclease/exonuclease/phosphatase family protein [Lacipirellula sp.]
MTIHAQHCSRRTFLTLSAALCALCGNTAFAELPQELRVITYNIHHGEGTDGKIDLERIAKLLMAEKPHLVAVNEVDQGTSRTHQIDMPAELARLTGMKAVFEKNIDFEGGRYGNAVLSSLPIRRHENHKLPSNYEGEQRGVLEIELGEDGGDETLLFLATHLDYRPDDTERMWSVKKIEEIIADRRDVPTILAGDLNASPDSRVMAAFAKTWTLANKEPLATFPAAKPEKQIDYILVRPADRWEVVEVRVLDESVASDHRPLLAVLRRVP